MIDTRFIIPIIVLIFTMASISIGIESINENPAYEEKRPASKGFLIFMLVINLLALLFSIFVLFQ